MVAMTWEYGGSVSWVTVRLRAIEAGATELELEHIAHVGSDDQWDQYGPGATGVGWDMSLVALAEHLPTGATVAGPAGEQWAASDNGKAFARQSSTAWARASIAAGTPEADALAAAARTSSAYAGEP
jgi:hypothetical protein